VAVQHARASPSGMRRGRDGFATRGSRCARQGWDDVKAMKRIDVNEQSWKPHAPCPHYLPSRAEVFGRRQGALGPNVAYDAQGYNGGLHVTFYCLYVIVLRLTPPLADAQASGLTCTSDGGLRRKDGRERIFRLDDTQLTDENVTRVAEKLRKGQLSTSDPACSVCASDSQLMVGRESGIVNVYSLPHVALERTVLLRCRPQVRAARPRSLASPQPLHVLPPCDGSTSGCPAASRAQARPAYEGGTKSRLPSPPSPVS